MLTFVKNRIKSYENGAHFIKYVHIILTLKIEDGNMFWYVELGRTCRMRMGRRGRSNNFAHKSWSVEGFFARNFGAKPFTN